MRWILLILLSNVVLASEMQDKVLEASYKQVGLDKEVNNVIRYGKRESELLGVDKEVKIISYGVVVYRTQCAKIPVRNNYNISVYRNKIMLEVLF